MTRYRTALLLPLLVLVACAPLKQGAPTDTGQVECEAAVARALDVLGTRAMAPVYCIAGDGRGDYSTSTNTVVVTYAPRLSPARLYYSVTHELGHAWDRWNGFPSNSARYAEIRGYSQSNWSEDYADVFARLAGNSIPGPYIGHAEISETQRVTLCNEGLVPC